MKSRVSLEMRAKRILADSSKCPQSLYQLPPHSAQVPFNACHSLYRRTSFLNKHVRTTGGLTVLSMTTIISTSKVIVFIRAGLLFGLVTLNTNGTLSDPRLLRIPLRYAELQISNHRSERIAPGRLKYDWNETIWNLDDGAHIYRPSAWIAFTLTMVPTTRSLSNACRSW
jgi:hypothetical protein